MSEKGNTRDAVHPLPPPHNHSEEQISIVMAGTDVHSEAQDCLAIYGPVIENTHSSLEYVVPSVEVRRQACVVGSY